MSAPTFESLTHTDFGEPLQWWRYTDSFATALFIDKRRRRRIKASAVHNGHQCYWHTPPGSVPLYGLASLRAKPDAPVLVVQSEEAADAARELFADHVCMTWAGGPNAVNQADTMPLGGRDVILWRDNTPESLTAMARFAVRLRGFARSVTIIDVPSSWPQKWHLAHELPPGVTVAMLRRMLPAVAPPEPVHDTSNAGDKEGSVPGLTLGARHSVARHAVLEAETRDGVARPQRMNAASEPTNGVSVHGETAASNGSEEEGTVLHHTLGARHSVARHAVPEEETRDGVARPYAVERTQPEGWKSPPGPP